MSKESYALGSEPQELRRLGTHQPHRRLHLEHQQTGSKRQPTTPPQPSNGLQGALAYVIFRFLRCPQWNRRFGNISLLHLLCRRRGMVCIQHSLRQRSLASRFRGEYINEYIEW